MTSVQSKIPFVERKKTSTVKFYSHKKDVDTSSTKSAVPSPMRRSSRIKKIVSLDSDEENIDYNSQQNGVEERGEEDSPMIHNTKLSVSNIEDIRSKGCSPPKIRRTHEKTQDIVCLSPTSNLLKNLTLQENEGFIKKCNDLNPYNKLKNARQALHSAATVNLPGREKELGELENVIYSNIKNGTSTSLYISGPPGTGKTACLSKIIHQFGTKLKIVHVNCTGIKNSKSIYQRIANELGIDISGNGERECKLEIEMYLHKEHETVLLILDEIDQLDSRKQNILYTIFEWPSISNSNLILIGIANALDLTDRILPRLQSKCELKPRLMHFAPYSKSQIVDIFRERLENSGVSDVFSPVAVQLLAGKVAALSGDARRALDIGRRVIELTEQQDNTGSRTVSSVELGQVVSVLNNVYSTSHTLHEKESQDSNETKLPLQQSILLCTLLLLLKKASNRDITVGRLHDVYRRICSKQNILPVDQTEFVGLCSLVDARGIIRINGKKEPRLQKVCLQWDEEEICSVLEDKQLMAAIMQDDSCLTR